MAARKVFHVTYESCAVRWIVWQVAPQLESRILRRSRTKAAAVKFAISKAKSRRHIGQVRIHNKNGRIESERTFGADPVATRG